MRAGCSERHPPAAQAATVSKIWDPKPPNAGPFPGNGPKCAPRMRFPTPLSRIGHPPGRSRGGGGGGGERPGGGQIRDRGARNPDLGPDSWLFPGNGPQFGGRMVEILDAVADRAAGAFNPLQPARTGAAHPTPSYVFCRRFGHGGHENLVIYRGSTGRGWPNPRVFRHSRSEHPQKHGI